MLLGVENGEGKRDRSVSEKTVGKASRQEVEVQLIRHTHLEKKEEKQEKRISPDKPLN